MKPLNLTAFLSILPKVLPNEFSLALEPRADLAFSVDHTPPLPNPPWRESGIFRRVNKKPKNSTENAQNNDKPQSTKAKKGSKDLCEAGYCDEQGRELPIKGC